MKYVVKNTGICRMVLDLSHVIKWLYKPFFMNCRHLVVYISMEALIFIWTFVDISDIHIWALPFIHMSIIVTLHKQCSVSS